MDKSPGRVMPGESADNRLHADSAGSFGASPCRGSVSIPWAWVGAGFPRSLCLYRQLWRRGRLAGESFFRAGNELWLVRLWVQWAKLYT